MKNIILLGAPGAGKGTLAKDLCPALKLKHISTGDLLRDVIASGSALGKELNGYVSTGALVPDDLIGKMIKETLAATKEGVLLDGFPRTVPQADMLETIMAELHRKIDHVFYLSIELDRVITRLVNRWSCPQCGRPYHLINLPPKQKGLCDDCANVALTQRNDDKEETIRKRFSTFIEKTQPLIDYYKNKNLLKEVKASDKAHETLDLVLNFMK